MYEEKYLIQIIKYLLNSDNKENVFPLPPEGLKWNEVMRIADRHSVGSLLYHIMPELSANAQPPQSTIESMRKKAMHGVVVDIRQQVEREELLSRFEEKGLFCMPLKGTDTKGYYLKSEWRTMGDIDILYKPEQHKKVKELLFEMGYTDYESGLKHDHYSKRPFITLEMHRELVAANTLAETYYSDVWEKAQPREGYKYVYQMSLEEQYIYTMVHLLEHFKNGGVGIRFIMDVYVFGKQEKLSRQYVKDRFKELGIVKFASHMEQLAQKWFGNSECVEELNDNALLSEIASFVVKNGTYGQSLHARDIAMQREGRKGYFKRMVFPNYNSMITLYPWLKHWGCLLPVAWIIRIGRTILFRKGSIQTGLHTLKYGDMQRGQSLMEFYRRCGLEDSTLGNEQNGLPVQSMVEIEEVGFKKEALDLMEILKFVIHPSEMAEVPKLIKPIDWDILATIAKKHNIFPLFYEGACQFPEYRERPDYDEDINTVIAMIGQQIKKTEVFLELYRAFLKEDLHPIVMKGLICRQLYGKNAEKRPSGDEDIFVRREDFYKIKEIMEAHGFVCSKPDVTMAQLEELQDVGFHESKTGFLIEVHTNLMGRDSEKRVQMGDCFGDVFKHAQTVIIRDVPITTMSHTDHFTFLILHAFKHFTLSGVGMRQMLDILLYQRTYKDEIDWEMVKGILEANHATSYMGDLQAIGRRYLGFESPVMVETCSPEELLEDMLEVGAFGKQDVAGTLAGRITLSTIDQKTGRIRTFLRAGFPSLEFMIVGAPHLKEKPWMLPLEWAKRWIRFIKKSRKYDGNLMKDSMEMSQKRKALLEKYGL